MGAKQVKLDPRLHESGEVEVNVPSKRRLSIQDCSNGLESKLLTAVVASQGPCAAVRPRDTHSGFSATRVVLPNEHMQHTVRVDSNTP